MFVRPFKKQQHYSRVFTSWTQRDFPRSADGCGGSFWLWQTCTSLFGQEENLSLPHLKVRNLQKAFFSFIWCCSLKFLTVDATVQKEWAVTYIFSIPVGVAYGLMYLKSWFELCYRSCLKYNACNKTYCGNPVFLLFDIWFSLSGSVQLVLFFSIIHNFFIFHFGWGWIIAAEAGSLKNYWNLSNQSSFPLSRFTSFALDELLLQWPSRIVSVDI